MPKNTIYTAACGAYEPDEIKKILFHHFDAVLAESYPDVSFPGKKVAIKPNLLAKREPTACITTHPLFVQTAAEYFRSKGASVVICDSPGGVYNTAALRGIYEVSGMKQAAENSGAALNYDTDSVEVFNKDGVVSKSFHIIKPLTEADFIVNLCRLKTHALCTMSAAVKNMYGSVPGLQKAEQHARFPRQEDFSRYLLDLCRTVSPHISVVDAVTAMEGNGPAGGTLKKVGLVLTSADPYALDYAASHLMDCTPDEVLTVKNAIAEGLCPASLSDIPISGVSLDGFVSHFRRPDSRSGGLLKQLPQLFGGRLRKWLEPRPIIQKDKCVGCGECARCCPQHAIVISEKKAKIDDAKCIRCYCCQELCPKKAVAIRQNPFMKL